MLGHGVYALKWLLEVCILLQKQFIQRNDIATYICCELLA